MLTTTFLYDHPRRTLLLATLVCALPILLLNYPRSAHDLMFHMQWTREFAAQFWGGDLYPRWLDNLNNGYGSPAFYYYPPMEGFLSTLLYPLAPLDPLGSIRVSLLVVITTFLSGLSAWWWLSRYTSEARYRLWGSLLYMLGPYHFMIDLYYRGAIAEFLAFIFFPLILGSLADMVEKKDRALFPVLLPISLGLLFMTHFLSGMMLTPFLILYVLMVPPVGERVAAVLRLGLAGLLAGGIAAIYLLPAGMQLEWANIAMMFGDYSESFLPGFWAVFDETSGLRLNTVVLNSCLLLLLAYGVRGVLDRGVRWLTANRVVLFWGIMFLGGIVMSTSLSAPIWYLVEPFQRLQFPWRFLTMATCALSPLVILSLDRSEPTQGRMDRLGPLLSLRTLTIVSALLLVGVVGYRYAVADRQAKRVDPWKNSVEWGLDAKEYTPSCLADPDSRFTPTGSEFRRKDPIHYARAEGGREIPIDRFELVGEGKNLQLLLEPMDQSVYVGIHRYYYPTWRGTADSKPIATRCSSPDGLLELQLPAGTSRVEISMVRSSMEILGGWISLAALVLVVVVGLIQRKQIMRHSRRADPTESTVGDDHRE